MQRDLLGKYQLLGLIGAGAQGTVHKALDLQNETVVAIKQLLPGYAASRDDLERFHREAGLLTTIEHRNVIKILDSCARENHGPDAPHYIVLEYIPDSSRDLLKEHPHGLPLPRALNIVVQAALALQAAWDAGVLHRDIKPSNILVGPGDSVKLSDFGVGRNASSRTLTSTGAVLGSLHYMAPELFEGDVEPDIRSDMYALGVTFFELLTGRVPFEGSEAQLVRSHLDTLPPSISSIRSDLPESLDEVIRRCLAKSPERRIREPKELIEALEALLLLPNDPSETLIRRGLRLDVKERVQSTSSLLGERHRLLHLTHLGLFFLVMFSLNILQYFDMLLVEEHRRWWPIPVGLWLIGITIHTHFIARKRKLLSGIVAAIGLLTYILALNSAMIWEPVSLTNERPRPVDPLLLPTYTGSGLLLNGSVEEASGLFPTGWRHERFGFSSATELLWASDMARTGAKSLLISDVALSDQDHPLAAWTSELIAVDPSETYEFSAWYYTPDRSGPALYVNFYNSQGISLGWGSTGRPSEIPESGKWHRANYRFHADRHMKTFGEPITSVELQLRYVINDPPETLIGTQARIYYDDMSFVMVDSAVSKP